MRKHYLIWWEKNLTLRTEFRVPYLTRYRFTMRHCRWQHHEKKDWWEWGKEELSQIQSAFRNPSGCTWPQSWRCILQQNNVLTHTVKETLEQDTSLNIPEPPQQTICKVTLRLNHFAGVDRIYKEKWEKKLLKSICAKLALTCPRRIKLVTA